MAAPGWRTGLLLAITVAVLTVAAGSTLLLHRPSAERLAQVGRSANLLLVTIDTCRADHLGCYGYPRGQTPVIDRLARQGVQFTSAFALQPITLPSHATILTGTHPAFHGIADNGLFRLPVQARTMAEVLTENRLTTGAIIAAFVLHRQFGLDQGFGEYDDRLATGRHRATAGYEEITADVVSDRAVRWIGRHREDRWFLWLHYFDPHGNYLPPAELRKAGLHPYDGEIAFVDRELGRVVDALGQHGLSEKTLLVLTADHGESLGEHQEQTHSMFCYDATMHVPLILSLPGALPAGKQVEELVSLMDIMPTALDLLGVEPEQAVQGRSLRPLLFGEAVQWPDEPVVMQTDAPWYQFGWSPSIALRNRDYKLIRAPRPELYRLADDPHERSNIYDRDRQQAEALTSTLEAHLERLGSSSISGHSSRSLDDTTRARLAALGYLFSGTSPDERPPADLPDAKDKVAVIHLLDRIEVLKRKDDLEQAIELLNRALAEDPGNRQLLVLRADCHKEQEAFPLAEADLREVLRLDPDRTDARRKLGFVLLDAGRFEEAEAIASELIAANNTSPEAYHLKGLSHLRRHQLPAAQQNLERAIELFPTFHAALYGLATVHVGLGELEKACKLYHSAAEILPDRREYQEADAQCRTLLSRR